MRVRATDSIRHPTSHPFRLGQALREVPLVVWGLALLLLLVSGIYSVAVPVYQGPDEPQHVDMVLSVGRLEGWVPPRQRWFSRQLRTSQKLVLHDRRARHPRAASEAVPRARRPSFDDLSEEPRTASRTHVANHPPLHYIVVAAWTTLVTGLVPALWDPAFDEVVGLLRLGSGLLLMWLPVTTFLTGRRLGLPRSTAVTAATVPLAIPQLAHIGGVVNNDALLIALAGAVFVLLSYVATGDASARTAFILGAVGGLALLAKGFALLAPVGMLLAYGAALRRVSAWRAARGCLLALAASLAVGGWWWVRNLLVEGRLQPAGGLSDFPHPAGFEPSVEVWWRSFYLREVAGFWGAFGNLNLPLPVEAVASAGSVLLMVILAAFITRRRGSEPGRVCLVLLLLPVLVLATLLPVRSWLTYATESTRIRGMQGRYLFLGLPGLATVAATGMGRFLPRSGKGRRWLPVAVLAGAIALHVVALQRVLYAYWGTPGPDATATALGALLRWAAWPEPVVLSWSATTGVVLLLVSGMLALSRHAEETQELAPEAHLEEPPDEPPVRSQRLPRPRSHRRTRRSRTDGAADGVVEPEEALDDRISGHG